MPEVTEMPPLTFGYTTQEHIKQVLADQDTVKLTLLPQYRDKWDTLSEIEKMVIAELFLIPNAHMSLPEIPETPPDDNFNLQMPYNIPARDYAKNVKARQRDIKAAIRSGLTKLGINTTLRFV